MKTNAHHTFQIFICAFIVLVHPTKTQIIYLKACGEKMCYCSRIWCARSQLKGGQTFILLRSCFISCIIFNIQSHHRKRGALFCRCIFGSCPSVFYRLKFNVLTLICHPGEPPVRKCPEAEVISVHAPIKQAGGYCSGLFFYENREEAYPHAAQIIKDNMTGSETLHRMPELGNCNKGKSIVMWHNQKC